MVVHSIHSQGSLLPNYISVLKMKGENTFEGQTADADRQTDRLTWNFLFPHSRRMDSRQSVLPHSRWSSWATSYLQCVATCMSHSNMNTDWSMRSKSNNNTLTWATAFYDPLRDLWSLYAQCNKHLHTAVNKDSKKSPMIVYHQQTSQNWHTHSLHHPNPWFALAT